jgi:hypothetical protein
MRWLLELGDGHVFLLQKCFVVGMWLIILLMHKNFRIARVGMWSMLVLYSLVIAFHLAIIASGVEPRRPDTEQTLQGAGASDALRSEEARDERRDGGLDAQAPLAEADGAKAPRLEQIELVGVPSALGADGEHDVAVDPSRTVGLDARMRNERKPIAH